MKRKSANGVALFLVENKPDAATWPVAPATVAEDAAVGTLDHIVIQTPNPERAVALYGGRLGLDLRLDRSNEQWGARQLFFRCGGAIVEIGASLKTPVSEAPDKFGGLAWRVRDPESARARIAAAGLDVSELRKGRKPGTSVFTVRSGTGGVPTLMLSGNEIEQVWLNRIIRNSVIARFMRATPLDRAEPCSRRSINPASPAFRAASACRRSWPCRAGG